MGLFSARFEDTVFLKETSDLQEQYQALIKLNNEYPNNEDILEELVIVKKGLKGENEIAYQLKKANIGMYVLRDIKLQYEDLSAQIDYVVITPVYYYYIECKNLVGDITINENGDFIRELIVNGKKVKKGMYSPLRQVEAQRDVAKKIWATKISKLKLLLAQNNFNKYRKVLVVAANPETIINNYRAPKDIKDKVIRADNLIRTIQNDLNNCPRDEIFYKEKDMREFAQSYLNSNVSNPINYYEYYKKKFNLYNKNTIEILEEENPKDTELRERLRQLRTVRSRELNKPAYYVFNNEEMENIIRIKPKTYDELRRILPDVKVNTHGRAILEEINK